MADIGTAYVSIMPSSRGLASSIANDLNGAAGPAGQSFGKNLIGKIKGIVGAAALGKTLVDALKMGAALEQSIGGVETLYKSSSDTVIAYAKEAWKTAGISANAYMEQSTSFAAALVGSLGGNTQKAAEAANTAIIDMSDNANKMGTSMESIQMAYQGFARGQYQLLDNLKLGYGGTKTEMERLLADASKLSGQKYDISNLSDVYAAIHVIQGELGITGTTAKEAATTLSGSFNAMKSSVQNLLGYLVNGGDISQAMADVSNSAATFLFDNLVPALGRVIMNLPKAAIGFIGQAVPTILNNITALLTRFANGDMDKSARKVIKGFVSGLAKSIPQVVSAMGKLVVALIKAVASLPGKLFDAAKTAISSFVKGLKNIRLPKMKITWGTESKTDGGKTIRIPLPHITWNAQGGIFTKPTVFQGVGEAGAEAVVPLSQLWNRFDNMAGQIASGVQTAMMMQNSGPKDIHLTVELGGSKVAEKIYRLNKQGEAALVG